MISFGIVGFVVMVGLMLVGLPIGAVALLVGLAGGMLALGMAFLNSAASVAWGTMSENGLTAIPLFVLLGEFLRRAGMPTHYSVRGVAGRLPGGLHNIGCCHIPAPLSTAPHRRSRPQTQAQPRYRTLGSRATALCSAS